MIFFPNKADMDYIEKLHIEGNRKELQDIILQGYNNFVTSFSEALNDFNQTQEVKSANISFNFDPFILRNVFEQYLEDLRRYRLQNSINAFIDGSPPPVKKPDSPKQAAHLCFWITNLKRLVINGRDKDALSKKCRRAALQKKNC